MIPPPHMTMGEPRVEDGRIITPVTFDLTPMVEAFRRFADAFKHSGLLEVARAAHRYQVEQEARQRRAHHHWRKKAGRPKGGHRR